MIFGWILLIILGIGGWIVSSTLNSKFKKYSQIPLNNGMTGREIAEKMLHDNGIYDVQVISTPGRLTDHYNPSDKTVNLSNDVYHSNSIAAAAVAAHECGHAVQHATMYGPLELRSKLVPAVSFASKWVMWIILAGIFMIQSFPALIWIGIGLFAITTIFSFVTLPVEINASQRALAWLKSAHISDDSNYPYAKDALQWAAYTYVIAALSSLATLIYYIMIALSRRN